MRRWLTYTLLLVALPVSGWSDTPPPPTEYQVKAAFIYNFMKFVEWPDSAFESARTPMTVSVLGTEDFVQTLRSAVAQRLIGDRAVNVVHSESVADVKRGHVLYVDAALADSMGQIYNRTRDAATLVVGDDYRMVGRGATIGFFLKNNKVRFTIDADLADESGLRISSRLLKLAQPSPDSEN